MIEESVSWLSRVRLADEVFQLLRDRIYTGRYAPGQSLPQVKIATELQISRTPLREAFRMLEREGLVTVGPHGTVRVISGDFQKLLDAYELREVIDGLAARLAARRSSRLAVERLEPLLTEQRGALDPWTPERYTEANVRFHAAIFELAENQFVSGQLPLVRITAQVFTPTALLSQERVYTAIAEHVEILEAIRRGDEEGAETLARIHIRRTITELKKKVVAGPPGARQTAGSKT
jgi:DNA-binding GntR family transcriptional regulator